MPTLAFALFDTAIGACAIAWGERGLTGVQLPEADAASGRARMRRRFPDAVEAASPIEVRDAIDAISALVGGEARDLTAVPLDMDGIEAFPRTVYAVARNIPPGQTLTYGQIAARLGAPREAARDVGEALGKNPFPIVVPCHRVLAAGGKLGGFSANGGVVTKIRLLEIEGAQLGDPAPLFDALPIALKPPRRR